MAVASEEAPSTSDWSISNARSNVKTTSRTFFKIVVMLLMLSIWNVVISQQLTWNYFSQIASPWMSPADRETEQDTVSSAPFPITILPSYTSNSTPNSKNM
jgi:hypothetical protein